MCVCSIGCVSTNAHMLQYADSADRSRALLCVAGVVPLPCDVMGLRPAAAMCRRPDVAKSQPVSLGWRTSTGRPPVGQWY
jgi:hypothetical protein